MSPPSEPARPGTKRLMAPALAAAIGALAIVAAFALGYAIAGHHTTVRTVTRTITAAPTTSPSPVTIVKTRTRTRRVTVTVPGIPCAVLPGGTLLPFPHGALGNATQTICTVTAVPPDALSEWQATAPNGETATFHVTSP